MKAKPETTKWIRGGALIAALWFGGFVTHAAYIDHNHRKPVLKELIKLEILYSAELRPVFVRPAVIETECPAASGLVTADAAIRAAKECARAK